MRYSGSLLKYSFNEASQPKGVHIVDMAADGSIAVETVPLKPRRELACLRGSFAELLREPQAELYDCYLQVTLTDEQPVLDAKYRLEQAYPHILHLEYARLGSSNNNSVPAADHKKLGPAELLKPFHPGQQQRINRCRKAPFIGHYQQRRASRKAGLADETFTAYHARLRCLCR